jgi:hypothetical protein
MERKDSFRVASRSPGETESTPEIIDQVTLTGSKQELDILINGLHALMGQLLNSSNRVQTNIDSPRIVDVELLFRQLSELTVVEEPVTQEPTTD